MILSFLISANTVIYSLAVFPDLNVGSRLDFVALFACRYHIYIYNY